MPLKMRDNFRNRKLEVCCLKYSGLRVSEERLCGRTQAGLWAARAARRPQAGLALSAPVFHRDWLVRHSHFLCFRVKAVCPFSSLLLHWRRQGWGRGGAVLYVDTQKNKHAF